MKKNENQHSDDMFIGAPATSFSKAESLRKNMTKAETALWNELKNKKLNGLKFRRQHPVQLYIADFYCHKLKLIIEIDGGYHLNREQKLSDEKRTRDLEDVGLTVIRLSNDVALKQIESVLQRIQDFAESQLNR